MGMSAELRRVTFHLGYIMILSIAGKMTDHLSKIE